MPSDTIDLVFSFDTTGSMYPCITQVRRYVERTVRELFDRIANIRIGIITHGDYCDGDECITSLDLTNDEREICRFIKRAPNTHGGDHPECYELVLNLARSMTWRSRHNKALVLIGDDVPHEIGYRYKGRRNDLDWENEAELLVEAGTQIIPVQALGRRHADSFYNVLAGIGETEKLELAQFSDVTDIILAICHQRAGKLSSFEETLRERHKPASWHVMANVDRLAGRSVRKRPKRSAVDEHFEEGMRTAKRDASSSGKTVESYLGFTAATDSGKRLIGVHPSRFQVLEVGDVDRTINDYVRENGLKFKKGKGFYQFTKPEIVQLYKEVVLYDPETGRFFTGNKARLIAGLPIGETGRFTPRPTEFTVFVQSTSANRRLKAGTRFLYELPDFVEGGDDEDGSRPERRKRTTRPPGSIAVTGARKCSICGEPGHNKRTCSETALV